MLEHMSLDQWQGHIKSHPGFGWLNTPQGRERVSEVMGHVAKAFGVTKRKEKH